MIWRRSTSLCPPPPGTWERFKILDNFAFPIATLGPSEDVRLIRARLLESEDTDLQHFSDFSYTPDPINVPLGRANLPGQIIFYARHDLAGALAQGKFMSGKEVGERVTFSFATWYPVKSFGVAIFANMHDLSPLAGDQSQSLVDAVKRYLNHWQDGSSEQSIELVDYLSKRLRTPIQGHERHLYNFTAALANHIFQSEEDLAGVFY